MIQQVSMGYLLCEEPYKKHKTKLAPPRAEIMEQVNWHIGKAQV